MERLNAVLVELQRLIVDGADVILSGGSYLVKNRASFRIFLRLGEHERGELLARKGAGAEEERSVQILVEGDKSGIECREREVVAFAKFLPVQTKGVRGFFSRDVIPAVRQDNASDVPKQRCNFRHGRGTSGLWTRVGLLRATFVR